MQQYIIDAILQHKLPPGFDHIVSTHYMPIAADLNRQLIERETTAKLDTFVLGVQGTQGSGKSTFADFLKHLMANEFGKRCAVLSLDDFYRTAAERKQLAQDVHPLLATRGVPGTHDVELAKRTFSELSALKAGETFALPSFNKAIDDRASEDDWPKVTGPIDVIIFEGWCVGAPPQEDNALIFPVNDLESTEDPDGAWRKSVNDQLAGSYQTLFSFIDALAVLTAPSFDVVFGWRLLQEQKLADAVRAQNQAGNTSTTTKVQTPEQLKRFIAHYQRLTEHCLNCLPEQADWVLELGEDHAINNVKFKR